MFAGNDTGLYDLSIYPDPVPAPAAVVVPIVVIINFADAIRDVIKIEGFTCSSYVCDRKRWGGALINVRFKVFSDAYVAAYCI